MKPGPLHGLTGDHNCPLPTTQEASSTSNTPGCSVVLFFAVRQSVEWMCCCASCAPVPSRPPRCQTPARSASPGRGVSLHSRKCTCTPRLAPLVCVLTHAQALCSVVVLHSRRQMPCKFFAPTKPQSSVRQPWVRDLSLCINRDLHLHVAPGFKHALSSVDDAHTCAGIDSNVTGLYGNRQQEAQRRSAMANRTCRLIQAWANIL